MEIITYEGRPFSVFVDGFVSHFALLQLYSHHLVLNFRNIEVESNDGSHFESLDALGPGRRIFKKMCTRSLTAKRLQNIVPYSFPNFNKNVVELCNNSDQTLFSNTLTFARSLGRC